MSESTHQNISYMDSQMPYSLVANSTEDERNKNKELCDLLIEKFRKCFPPYRVLSSFLSKVDSSSLFPIEVRGENSSLKDNTGIRDAILRSISDIINKLVTDKDVFKKVNKTRLMKFLSDLMKKLPEEQFIDITENELFQRVEKIMLVEATAGMLSDLSPKQLKSFEASIKRRALFK